MIIQVRCNTCKAVVKLDDQRTTSCFCDPTAPTWVGLDCEGNLMYRTEVDLTVLEGETE